ncbi:MAG: adenylate/guanylate cyclase domain-containing protein [Myxococcota bacterium]
MYQLRLKNEAARPMPLDGARLLVVAAKPKREMLTRTLRDAGADLVCIDGVEAPQQTPASWSAELALVDLTLEHFDSIQICEGLQVGENPPAVIGITGLSRQASAQKQANALSVGVCSILNVSQSPTLVVQMLLTQLNTHRKTANYRRRIARLETYVPTAAIARPDGPPELIDATLLFSDLRGFTAASFTQDAGHVFDLINQILAAQIDRIQAAGGYVDGFSGDGLLALFEGEDGASRACAAASAILAWADRTAIPPFAHLPVGMGLHCGEVMRGDLGVPRRRVFTALGTPVNIAARLCGVARAGEAIVSQRIINTAGRDYNFTSPRAVDLKGIPLPFPVQTLIR